MDGLHSLKTVWRTAWFRFATRQIMSILIGSACLLNVSGCAFSRNMLHGPAAATAATAGCTKPDCAAPVAAAAAMTAMPVPQVSPAQVQPAAQVPQIPTAGPVQANAAYGMAAATAAPMPVPQVPAMNMPVIPQGWKLVPDVPEAVPSAGFMAEHHSRQQAECLDKEVAGAPVEWPVDEKLLRCERQVAEMTEKIMGLQNVTEVTKQAMLSMELEQIRLRNENEVLKRRADESHREVIKSIDSLSEYMDEVIPAEVPPQKSTPTRSVRSTAKPAEQTSVLPPVDEEL